MLSPPLTLQKRPIHPERGHAWGAIATLADPAVAVALLTLVGLRTEIATIDLNVSYLASVKSGIVAEAKIIHKGSEIAVGDVEIRDEENKLVAKASATYFSGGCDIPL